MLSLFHFKAEKWWAKNKTLESQKKFKFTDDNDDFHKK